jgi:C4-dicarboxylate transporter DctM subunit
MLISIGIFFLVFLVLAFLRVPVGFAILAGALIGYAVSGLRMDGIPAAFLAGLDSFPLLAIPAFIYAGDIMATGGISKAISSVFLSLFGRFRGSLGSALVATCMLFGAITGSSIATVSAVGGIMAPEMTKNGYSKDYTTALLAAAGFLGILIPPSVPGIMFAMVAGQKVTAVWISTLMPGIALGILYMVANYFFHGRNMPKIAEAFDVGKFASGVVRTLPRAVVAIIMILIIFVGVYGGIFTPTEAGAVSVLYGIFAGWIIFPKVFKERPSGSLLSITRYSALTCGAIGCILAAATVVGRLVTMSGVTEALTTALMNFTESKIVFLIVANLILILCGMLLESITAIILFAPILCPIATAYGVDPVHFGAIMLVNLGIGLITPPFAANIFVACRVTKQTFDRAIKPMLPFYVAAFIVLVITTYVPEFSLFLVNMAT